MVKYGVLIIKKLIIQQKRKNENSWKTRRRTREILFIEFLSNSLEENIRVIFYWIRYEFETVNNVFFIKILNNIFLN